MSEVTWKKARKIPIVVEFREVQTKIHIRTHLPSGEETWGELIETEEGIMEAHVDKDYIIKGVEGELYPIKKTIFEKTYVDLSQGGIDVE